MSPRLIEVDPIILSVAVSYALGRMTYMPSLVVDEVIRCWPVLDERAKFCIRRDVLEAFKDDDRQRAAGEKYTRLGMDCDRETWERLLPLFDAKKETGHA